MATNESWMQKPMPPGWASKYDQSTGKYFFIDHRTKKTQWVDPRIAFYANQPSANLRKPVQGPPKCKTCNSTQVYAVGVECTSCRQFAQRVNNEQERAKEQERLEKIRRQQVEFDAAEKKRKTEERIAAEKKRKEEWRIKAEKKRQHEEQMAADSLRRQMQLLAKRQTPQPTQEKPPEQIALQRKGPPKCKICHSTQVYAEGVACFSCQRMMKQEIGVAPAKKVLEQKKQKEEERVAAEKKRQQEERIAAQQRQKCGQSDTQETTFITKDEEVEVIPALTMYQKITMVNDLQVIYTDVSRSVIDMILESCSYKKEMACAILNSMSSKRAPPTTQGSSSPIKTSPLVDQSKSATSKEPAQKTRGESATTTPVSKATTSSPMATTATASSTKSTVSASTPSKTAPKPAVVKKVTAARKPSPSSPKQAQEIRKVKKKMPVSETKRSKITFTHSTVAKGRDVNLAKGPNKDLLLTNYVLVGGHNGAITRGPNLANVRGPSGASSKISTLAKGPQVLLRNGPQHRLGKGSVYQADRQG